MDFDAEGSREEAEEKEVCEGWLGEGPIDAGSTRSNFISKRTYFGREKERGTNLKFFEHFDLQNLKHLASLRTNIVPVAFSHVSARDARRSWEEV
jgi:hypothetical protein